MFQVELDIFSGRPNPRWTLDPVEESDLRTPLRAGASDEELAERWRAAVLGKKAGHGIDDPTFLQPVRSMSAIGG